jgi:hypothetical protein
MVRSSRTHDRGRSLSLCMLFKGFATLLSAWTIAQSLNTGRFDGFLRKRVIIQRMMRLLNAVRERLGC